MFVILSLPNTACISASCSEDKCKLADNNFSQSTVPVTNINEGDTWYNTSTDDFYVYRETSVGVFEWVPIILGAADGDSDTLDAGAF